MSEEQISHIEIEQEETPTQETKKVSAWDRLKDLEGWKKDAKKIIIALLVIAVLAIVAAGGMKFFQKPMGFRFQSPIQRVKFQTAQNAGFSFQYPDKYVYDGDPQKKYGQDYLGGFHLANDSRTGCDVRANEVGINFSKSEQEINGAVAKELSASVKGLDQFSGKKIKLGKSDAYTSGFLMTDPLGNTLHINQTFVSNNGQNYLLICGSSEAQYAYLQQDFQDFLDSFTWKN